jgi:hypothetical protein
MSARKTHLKLVGAASAALLTVGVVSAPALAAAHDVSYSCFGGALTIPITMDVGTLPTSLVAGQKVTQTIISPVAHLPAQAVQVAQAQGWDAVSATTVSATGTPYALNLPKTALPPPVAPPALPSPLDIPGTGAFTITSTKAGTVTVAAGDMTATIQGYKSGAPANAIPLDCVAPTDGTQNFGTIAVTKDKSKTVAVADYNAKKDKATGSAKVKGATFGLKGTGKVKFTLKKGTHVVDSKKGKLNAKGKAVAVFAKVSKAGNYSITATFGGDGGLKGSKDKATFTVK